MFQIFPLFYDDDDDDYDDDDNDNDNLILLASGLTLWFYMGVKHGL
jgi:hypothetical protein